jgi:hypothetical protein
MHYGCGVDSGFSSQTNVGAPIVHEQPVPAAGIELRLQPHHDASALVECGDDSSSPSLQHATESDIEWSLQPFLSAVASSSCPAQFFREHVAGLMLQHVDDALAPVLPLVSVQALGHVSDERDLLRASPLLASESSQLHHIGW